MPRDIPIGNNSLLIAYDRSGVLRDLYFPNVGSENHAQGRPFRLGVWAGGLFSWTDGPEWERYLGYEEDTLVARISLKNTKAGVELSIRDAVDFHENLYVREMTIRNLSAQYIDCRIFFYHDLRIYGADFGDTACYKPEGKAILHYKGKRYFLINAGVDNRYGASQFATGAKESKGFAGTWKDAEDGVLSGNPIEQGSVDSTCSVQTFIPAGDRSLVSYWMAAGSDWREVRRLNELVMQRSPVHFIKRTADYWKLWLDGSSIRLGGLSDRIIKLYKRSILLLKTHSNNNGSVIAASDSDVLQFYRDTHSYLWPRDGALTAHAFDVAGYPLTARSFYNFCGEIIGRDGYFLHKYNSDGTLASSWHPWVLRGEPMLPIQEDETGLVIWTLWEHFSRYQDVEFIKPLYRKLIKSAADFMCAYVDEDTGLPKPSYDLWEEGLCIHTFTTCAVIAGLKGAARFTEAFGETAFGGKYLAVAERMKESLLRYLYDETERRFLRRIIRKEDGLFEKDYTIDASLCGLFLFDVFPATDEKVAATARSIKDALWCKTGIGGIARYQNDVYQAAVSPIAEVPGNPWIVSTLWYSRFLLETAEHGDDLMKAAGTLDWVVDRALSSGILPEQVNPVTGEHISVSPLVWSHAELVITVQKFMERFREMEKCPLCKQPLHFKV